MMFVERLGALLRAWVWYVAITGLFIGLIASFAGLDRLHGPGFWSDPAAIAMFGGLMLIGTATGVLGSTAWLRMVVEPDQGLRIQWKRAEWVFLGRLAQLAIVCAIVLLVVTFIVTLIIAFAFGDVLQPASAERPVYAVLLMGVLGTAILVVPASFCATWYSFSLPAAACGAQSGLLKARDQIKGHAGRFFWAFVITITIFVLSIELLESLLAGISPQIVVYAAKWLVLFLAYVMCLTMVGLFYRALVPPRKAVDGSKMEVRAASESS